MDVIKREFREDEISLFGWVIFPTFVLYDSRLTQTQKILYCILRRYSRENGYCFPAIKRIAKGLGMTERTVCSNLSALVDRGLIAKSRRYGRSTVYKFNEMKDVYSTGGKLKDSVIDDLRFAGEEKNVDLIMRWRSDNSPVVSSDEQVKKTKVSNSSTGESVPEKKKPHVPLRDFDKAFKAVSEMKTKAQQVDDKKRRKRAEAAKIDELEKPIAPPREHRFSSRDVENAWRVAADKKWPEITLASQRFDKAFLTIARRLGEKYGYEFVMDACEKIIENWEDYADRYGIKGLPNMKLVAYFSEMWFSEIRSDKKFAVPGKADKRREALEEGEYNDKSEGKFEAVGFLGKRKAGAVC